MVHIVYEMLESNEKFARKWNCSRDANQRRSESADFLFSFAPISQHQVTPPHNKN